MDKGFRDTDDLDGLFSGWDQAQARYDAATWQYGRVGSEPAQDLTLQDPRCVLQILKRHFSR